MNHFFYESRGKEKIKNFMEEGMRSQAYYRSSTPKDFVRRLPQLLLLLLGLLGILGLLWH
jgi:hypothetical protein